QAWKRNLSEAKVEYLVLGYSFPEGLENVYPFELEWVKEYPEDFEMVVEDDGVFIYQVVE
ncbi:MAG: hypothetical protein U1C97_03680, partial [Candidatus Gracilibacteria bacterium]|nr:hypothetical protein [Candidatus Gracilibacteria bacterium]